MADIIIATTFNLGASNQTDAVAIPCRARCSGMNNIYDTIEFEAVIPIGASAATINQAIKDAAIAAADLAGYVVGASDKKIILGEAIGL